MPHIKVLLLCWLDRVRPDLPSFSESVLLEDSQHLQEVRGNPKRETKQKKLGP